MTANSGVNETIRNEIETWYIKEKGEGSQNKAQMSVSRYCSVITLGSSGSSTSFS